MIGKPSPAAERFWASPPGAMLARLKSDPKGLAADEAVQRLAETGPNRVVNGLKLDVLTKIGRRLIEPLVAILLVAALVSGLTGDWPGFVIICAIVAFSVGLDVVQEHRAELAAENLRNSVAVKAAVWRDGQITALPVEKIVPGDVIELSPGGLVPADGILLQGNGAQVNEALLTGEPYPVAKRPGVSDANNPADAFNAVFAGTAFVAGSATMLAVATGQATQLGGVAASLALRRPPTAFEMGLHGLGLLILRLTAFLVLLVLLAHLGFQRPPLESFLFAIALAVGLTPELLPMVTTVTLSRGAIRMAQKRVVVKRLAAIHDLGAMDVLCTDKTGTLTEAKIALAEATGPDGAPSQRVLNLAALNAGLASGVPSTLDAAIRAACPPAPSWRLLAEAPFDFERRRSAILCENDAERLLVVKGAPEAVLAVCNALENADSTQVPMTDALRATLLTHAEARGADGLRLLGVAWRAMREDETIEGEHSESSLAFTGFCAFLDPPKSSAIPAVVRLAALGVSVKVISGDAAPVLLHLVQSLGLPCKGLLTGDEIDQLDQSGLVARVRDVDLYARVSPDQKRRVILALKALGHTVGFIGDGINDAPAIHAADAGLSVEGATEVARAAADLILLSPDLGVLADGVQEGRRTYANIMKYVRMGTSSNFGNMFSMAVASLLIPFLPLLPAQILLNNLLYDLSEMGIPFDAVDAADMAKPHGWDMASLLRFTLVMGPLSSVFDLATFAILLWGFGATPEQFRTAWFIESMATQVLVIFLIRTHGAAWKAAPHPALVVTSLSALGMAVFLALGPFAPLLGFAPLPGLLLGLIVVLVVSYLACAEGLKRVANRA